MSLVEKGKSEEKGKELIFGSALPKMILYLIVCIGDALSIFFPISNLWFIFYF